MFDVRPLITSMLQSRMDIPPLYFRSPPVLGLVSSDLITSLLHRILALSPIVCSFAFLYAYNLACMVLPAWFSCYVRLQEHKDFPLGIYCAM